MPPSDYQKHVVPLPRRKRNVTVTSRTKTFELPARVLKFPTTIQSNLEQNGRRQKLAVCEKRSIVANRLYELLISILNDEAVDPRLVERVYKAFFLNTKN